MFAAALASVGGWVTMGAFAINAIVAPWYSSSRPRALSSAYNGASVGGVVFSPLWAVLIARIGFVVSADYAIQLFGSGIGNATSLPPLVAQLEFTREHLPRAVALTVAVSRPPTPPRRRFSPVAARGCGRIADPGVGWRASRGLTAAALRWQHACEEARAWTA